MRRAKLFNEMDELGAGAVLVAYLTWALYQVNRQGRNPLEVHIALTVALIIGLAYRLLWQRMPPRASEIFARLLLRRGWYSGKRTVGYRIHRADSQCEPEVVTPWSVSQANAGICQSATPFGSLFLAHDDTTQFRRVSVRWSFYRDNSLATPCLLA